VRQLVIPFIKAADDEAQVKPSGTIANDRRNVLVQTHQPADLAAKLKLVLPEEGEGQDGLLNMVDKILQYSVNTWDQGFLDKLYASNTPVRCYPILVFLYT
jgi:glutamate decarboxylase